MEFDERHKYVREICMITDTWHLTNEDMAMILAQAISYMSFEAGVKEGKSSPPL